MWQGVAGEIDRIQIMAGMLALFSDGLVIGERTDIPPHRMLVSNDFSPHLPLKQARKDLVQALSCADKLVVSCPVTASANAQFIRAKDMGFGVVLQDTNS